MSKKIFFAVALVIIFEQVLSQNTLYNNDATENISACSVDTPCYSNVQHLNFRIAIGVFNWSENAPDPENLTVPVWAKITFRVQKATQPNSNSSSGCESKTTFNTLQLNPRGCQINWNNLTVSHIKTGERLKVAKILPPNNNNITESDDDDRFSIQLAECLPFDEPLELHIQYKLTLAQKYFDERWQGLYFYNPKHLNSSDQFNNYSPYHAPFIFPTLYSNEPKTLSRQRATFKISVARPENRCVSVSNMDVVETVNVEEINDAWVQDNFRQSPPMPLDQVTVLIMWGFENQTAISENSEDKVVVWSSAQQFGPPANNNSDYSASTILKIVGDFEKNLNETKLPVGKLDVISVPFTVGQLGQDANLGVSLFYGADYYDADDPHFYAKQVGFQWLGGMVSVGCDSEDSLYCTTQNEDLLRYMVKLIQGTDFPLNKETFNLDIMQDVFSPPVMQSAVTNFYLPKMKWTTTSPRDFYDSLQQAIKHHNQTHRLPYTSEGQYVTVGEVIASWHHHKFHYPRLYVSQVENDSRAILISQRDLSDNPTGDLWWVPLKISTEAGEDVVWLAPNETKNSSKNTTNIWFKKDVIDTNKWLVINPDATGYYSVEYSEPLWRNLVDQLILNHTVIGTNGRNNLIIEHFPYRLLKNDWEKIRQALEITQYLRNERSDLVWASALERIVDFRRNFLQKSQTIGLLAEYFGSLINSVLEDIGTSPTPEETGEVKRLRENLMKYCGVFEVPVCTQYGVELMSAYIKNPQINPFRANNISVWTEQGLCCAAIRDEQLTGKYNTSSSIGAFEFVVNQLLNNTDVMLWHMCDYIGASLVCTTNEQLLVDLLNNTKVDHGNENWKHCFVETIAHEILSNKPFTMTPAVIEFWMRELLEENISSATFMRHLWSLSANAYCVPGLDFKIKQFLKINAELFKGDLEENVANFKLNIDTWRNHSDVSKSKVDNIIHWFRDNHDIM